MIGRLLITLACYVTFIQAKPIMVSFGTKGGPIVPPTPSTTTLNPLAPKNPAPVYEQVDDIPPPAYRPPTPNQYRNQINTFKPNPNLQLGTPLDIKYQEVNTLSQLQVQQQKADYARQQGLGYTGAQVFGVQAYEYDNARNRQQQLQQGQQGQAQAQGASQLTSAQQFVQQYVPKRQEQPVPQVETNQEQKNQDHVRQQRHQEKDQVVQGSTRYTNVYSVSETQPLPEPQLAQPQQYHYQYNNNFNHRNNQHPNENQNGNQVPGIGIAYSSGLRYYVPQFYYYDSRQQQQQPQFQKRYNDVRDNAIYGH